MKILSLGSMWAVLAACASYSGYGLQPGVATEPQVLAAMGEPALKFRDADGTSTWAYPHGPLGYDTFMARFTGAGVLVRIDKVLDPEHFARVTLGLSPDDVQRIIGPPGRAEVFRRQGELVWDYRFVDAWGYSSQFSVIFDAERRVRRTLTWREDMDSERD